MHQSLRILLACIPLTACASTDDVVVELAPDLISSLDGTMSLRVTALSDGDPYGGDSIDIAIAYTDRNGTDHAIEALKGSVNDAGVFEGDLAGFDWDGAGTVTATVHGDDGDKVGIATFAVLDRTPPVLSITPPANNQLRVNQDTTISVKVTDEIGVSQVFFEANYSRDNNNRARSTVVASGSLDSTIEFDLRAQDTQVGETVTLYALGSDLSGNQAAAPSITLTVVQ